MMSKTASIFVALFTLLFIFAKLSNHSTAAIVAILSALAFCVVGGYYEVTEEE